MEYKYSLAYLTVPGTDPVSQIRMAKETGYDFVSLRTIPMHLPGEPEFLLHKDENLFNSVKNALSQYDMKLNDIELARIRKDLDIKEYEPAFEKAAILGATDVLSSVWTRDRDWYTEKTAQLCKMAGNYGLCVNIEFLPWAGVRNLQEDITLVNAIRDMGMENVFIMVDTLHAGRAGVTSEEILRNRLDKDKKTYYRFMHICDGPAGKNGDPVLDDINDELMLHTAREERFYPGEGVMDVIGMVEATGCDILTIELPNLCNIKKMSAKGHAASCLNAAKTLLS